VPLETLHSFLLPLAHPWLSPLLMLYCKGGWLNGGDDL